ncbi:MAG: hypothetical protein DRP57_08700 [Spirochaetes bacterium]|nr:MAG: hypothetical protein DRP57_08700 [Spirochaetota bacterium]
MLETWELVIILVMLLMIFGAKRILKTIGSVEKGIENFKLAVLNRRKQS